jgi:hypothetical protein
VFNCVLFFQGYVDVHHKRVPSQNGTDGGVDTNPVILSMSEVGKIHANGIHIQFLKFKLGEGNMSTVNLMDVVVDQSIGLHELFSCALQT